MSSETLLFNDAVLAYVAFQDPTSDLTQLLENQPQHTLALCYKLCLDILGTGIKLNHPSILSQIETISSLDVEDSAERLFVEATLRLAKGEMQNASEILEELISISPLVDQNQKPFDLHYDLLAVRFNQDIYFYLGMSKSIRDSVARIVDQVELLYGSIAYGYVLGMYAFGLEECGEYREAEKTALRALEINPKDAWAVHAATHVMEMEGRQEEGIQFLVAREKDWAECTPLACHNYWHWALHLIELGELTEAVKIYDTQISKRINSGAMLDMVDGASALARLNFEYPIPSSDSRWKQVQDLWRPHLDDHVYAFNDIHIAVSCQADTESESKFLETLEQYVSNYTDDTQISNQKATHISGYDTVQAVIAYNHGEYAKTVELLYPVLRDNRLIAIGGSHAQRDLFELILINACIKCENMGVAQTLLKARKDRKPNSGQTDRLIQKLPNGLDTAE